MVMLLQPDFPPEIVQIAQSFFFTIAVIGLGIPVINAFTKRWARGPLPPPVTPPDVTERLERIEQAIESVAIEVERIAEAQRFSAKLLAEQQKHNLPRSSAS